MNVYESIGLKKVINASGRMTALGVSTISDAVAEYAKAAAQSYVVIDDLFAAAGKIVAQYTTAEAACVTSSASAGIAMSVAGIISEGDFTKIRQLPDSTGMKNQVIIQKGHVVNFGAPVTSMIRLGGGVPVEIGMANEVTEADLMGAINDQTAAIIYIKSHHCIQKGMLPMEVMMEIAHQHQLPFIVDAAAEEDLQKYVQMGADLVIYSGAKALEATTSGFVTGKEKYINWVSKQYGGVGRAMKIGKEGIMGLVKALELYVNRDEEALYQENLKKVDYIINGLQGVKGLKVEHSFDEAGRKIVRARITVNEAEAGMSALALDKKLKAGNPSIHCRKHLLAQGIITYDPRPITMNDAAIIVNRIKEVLG